MTREIVGGRIGTRLTTLTGRLGGPRFAAAVLLDALGSGVMTPLSVLFFTLHEHMRPTTVGLGITIGGAAALVLAPLAGQMIDSLGAKHALLITWPVAAAAAASYVLVHDLLELALMQSVMRLASEVAWNSAATLLTGLSDEAELSRVMATQYSLRNLVYGAGGLLSVLALALGGVAYDIAAYGNAASFLIAALLALGVNAPQRRPPAADRDPTTIWTVLTDVRYVSLALLGTLIAFHQVALLVVLPLWIVLQTHAPREVVGRLFTLNTIVVVICQVRVSAVVTDLADANRAYMGAVVAIVAAAGTYIAAHYAGAIGATALLVLGTVALTTTEMLASACEFVVSLGLAPAAHRGKYLSVFGIGWSIESMAGPAVGTALLSAGLLAPWPALAAMVAAGALSSSGIVRRAQLAGPALSPEQ